MRVAVSEATLRARLAGMGLDPIVTGEIVAAVYTPEPTARNYVAEARERARASGKCISCRKRRARKGKTKCGQCAVTHAKSKKRNLLGEV